MSDTPVPTAPEFQQAPPDPTVAQALGAAGACPQITVGQTAWTVGWPTQKAKTVLEQLVVEVCTSNLKALRDALPPADYAARDARLEEQILAGHWRSWGQLWSAVVNGPDGFPVFLCSLLREHHPQGTLAEALEQARTLWLEANRSCRRALTAVVPGFFDLLAKSLPADSARRTRASAEFREELLKLLALPTLTATD
jgi:hypothetical protein